MEKLSHFTVQVWTHDRLSDVQRTAMALNMSNLIMAVYDQPEHDDLGVFLVKAHDSTET